MKKQLVGTVLIIIFPCLLISCVSSLLKEKAPTFSSEVSYKEPALPFYQLHNSVYPSWRNSKTGNVLSIFSDCQSETTLSLGDLQKVIEDSVESSKRINESFITYKNKPALLRTINGEVESNPIQIKSMAFIQNSCGYVISLSGKPAQVTLDQNSFDHFIQGLTFK